MKRTTLTLSKVKKRGKRKNERIYVNYFKSTTTSNKLKWKLFQLLHNICDIQHEREECILGVSSEISDHDLCEIPDQP
jgi:transcription initiation factor IIE alpha subunit